MLTSMQRRDWLGTALVAVIVPLVVIFGGGAAAIVLGAVAVALIVAIVLDVRTERRHRHHMALRAPTSSLLAPWGAPIIGLMGSGPALVEWVDPRTLLKSGEGRQTRRSDRLAVTLEAEERVFFRERKVIVGVSFRVENLTTRPQTLHLAKWTIRDLTGMRDEVFDGAAEKECEKLARQYEPLPGRIQPGPPVIGWSWRTFPRADEPDPPRRLAYLIVLTDGAKNEYRFQVDEWRASTA